MVWSESQNLTEYLAPELSPSMIQIIEGESSGARYSVRFYDSDQTIQDTYSQNNEFEDVAEVVVDDEEFNQFNPFGEV